VQNKQASALRHAEAQAKAAIQSAERQVGAIRAVADQLVETSSRLAASGAEVLGGVLGASVMAAVGLALLTPLGLPALVVPFLCVGGASAGVFAARGMEGVRGDRRRRGNRTGSEGTIACGRRVFHSAS